MGSEDGPGASESAAKSAAVEERYRIEREKFDDVSAAQELGPEAVLSADMTFARMCREDTYFPGMADYVGDLRGKSVLELGCGTGETSVALARSGANVSAFDISPGSVEVARKRADMNGVADATEFVVAAGEDLPYEDGSFDVVIGSAVLHHLEVERAGPETRRVMRSGALAAFSEPLANNPVVRFARDHVWYPRKSERGTDVPLRYSDLRAWGEHFDEFTWKEIHLLGMAERLSGWRWKFHTLHKIDRVVLDHVGPLRPLANYSVIFARRA